MLAPDAIIADAGHRPWKLPSAPWFMFQQWNDLLFAHWALDPLLVRSLVPEELELDLHDGKAWISISPFRMSNIHLRGLPPIPGTGEFLEMNLRTYVRASRRGVAAEHPWPGGSANDSVEKPGIYFFSLDASNLPAVVGARVGFGLPYFWSNMSIAETGDGFHYTSKRRESAAEVDVRYHPTQGVINPKSALDRFLTERYCLYEVRAGIVMRTEIHHVPWPIQHAKASFSINTVGAAHRLPLSLQPDLTHFSRQIDVLIYPPGTA